MEKTVISLDVGTTHIKAALFDNKGKMLQLEKQPTPSVSGEYGPVYDAVRFREIVLTQMGRLLKNSPSTPVGICITGMAEAGLILDRNSGEPLTELLPWFHPGPRCLSDAVSQEESDRLFRQTGLRNSFKYGIYKYRWLLSQHHLSPENTVWLSVCDYVAFCLTGKMVTDPTFAARTYVYDVHAGKWDTQRLDSLGLSEENFPVILPSGSVAGEYQGIPVAIGGHDHICAAFGLLFHHPDAICDSAGTSETCVGLLSSQQVQGSFPEDSGLLYGPFVDGGYFYMGNVPSSGHSVEWFRKKLQISPLEYREIDEKMAQLQSGPTGILYLPYLTGMGAPWYRPDVKAVLLGMGEEHDGAQILKSIFEGIQFQICWLLEILEKYHQISVHQVICAGGLVKNPLMMQIKADVLNCPVRIPAVSEATLSGAAALFLKKNGNREEADLFLQGAAQIQNEYLPSLPITGKYRLEYRKKYLPAVKMVSSFFEET